jgi:hypothetical protein
MPLAVISNGADAWTIVSAVTSAIMAAVAVLALVLAIPQLRHNARTLQLQVFESIFRDIRQLEHMWIEQKFDAGMPKEQRQAWCASFFNTVEYLCFLMNHEIVRQKELHDFFDGALPVWHNQFNEYIRQGLLTDTPAMFTEFKKICEKLKLNAAG